MSYRVEVTASTVTELAGKLLALAATMQTVPVDPVMQEVKPKPKKVKEAAEQAPAPEPQTSSSGPSTPVENTSNGPQSDEQEAPAEEAKSSDLASPTPPASASEPLDFDKDVAPVVLKAVKDHGKPWVQEILSQFGFERASQVPDEQHAELVAALSAGPQE